MNDPHEKVRDELDCGPPEEQATTADAVDKEETWKGAETIYRAHYHGDFERVIEARGFKEGGAVVKDEVDAGHWRLARTTNERNNEKEQEW